MYYELYIDVFFLINFMMDYLMLLIVKRILKCSATHKNICIGSLFGSLSVCVVTAMPLKIPFLKLILFHVVINTQMLKIGLRIKKKELPRAFLALYAGGFLLGGIFTFLRQYIRTGSLFFAAAVLSYHAAQGIWSFLGCLQRFNQSKCTVTLYFGEKNVH